MVILDIMMPNMDGWELCREIRDAYDIPLLMLTARGDTSQKVKGFQLGTDDYLVKPFEPPELVARVKALLRRYRVATSGTVQIGELLIDRRTYEVTDGGRLLTLPRKEFELLYKLAGYPGRTFSRDELIEDIWGFDFEGNERTLDVHINRLRERFPEEDHASESRRYAAWAIVWSCADEARAPSASHADGPRVGLPDRSLHHCVLLEYVPLRSRRSASGTSAQPRHQLSVGDTPGHPDHNRHRFILPIEADLSPGRGSLDRLSRR